MDLRGVYVWTVVENKRHWRWIADGEGKIFTLERLTALLRGVYANDDPGLNYNPVYHPRIILDKFQQQYVGGWRDPMRPGYKRTLAQLNQKPLFYTPIVEAAQALPAAPEPEPFVITDLDLDLDL